MQNKIIADIRKLCKDSQLANQVMAVLHSQRQTYKTTDIRRTKKYVEAAMKRPLKFSLVLDVFVALDKLGAGKVEYPKQSFEPHRFKWVINYKEVLDSVTSAPAASNHNGAFRKINFPMSCGTASMQLPLNMTIQDVELLCQFLKANV